MVLRKLSFSLRHAHRRRFILACRHGHPHSACTPCAALRPLVNHAASVLAASQASAWMAWEMAVGFSNSKQMAMWNGSAWESCSHPRPQGATYPKAWPAPGSPPAAQPASSAAEDVGSGPALPEDEASLPWEEVLGAGLRYGGDARMSTQGAQALLEAHYSVHGAFLAPGQLLAGVHAMRHIPCIAVHGAADYVCPPTTAYELHQAWPEMELRLVPGAGHSMYDPAITHELVEATDAFAQRLLAGGRGAESTHTLVAEPLEFHVA